MLSPRPANFCTTESTSRRLPEINSSRALLSPCRACSRRRRISGAFNTGSVAVLTPQISTFPCILTPSPLFKGGVSISRPGKFDTE